MFSRPFNYVHEIVYLINDADNYCWVHFAMYFNTNDINF